MNAQEAFDRTRAKRRIDHYALAVPCGMTLGGLILLAIGTSTKALRIICVCLLCVGGCSLVMGLMALFALFLLTSAVEPSGMDLSRQRVVETILGAFFDTSAVGEYVHQRLGQMTVSLQLAEKTRQLMESPEMDDIISSSWREFVDGPDGQLMTSLGIDLEEFTPIVRPLLIGVICDLCPAILEEARPTTHRLARLLETHTQTFIAERLEVLHTHAITRQMASAVRPELQMIVVHFVVAGMLVGVCAAAALLLNLRNSEPDPDSPNSGNTNSGSIIVHLVCHVMKYVAPCSDEQIALLESRY
ncbi:hypothetical protein SARC_04951 [Sphaeroforma arctica JP610]|uniref:Uncharacterized protein n=1 Tax=Sphaeroforma arctica JP610 TaxID=667725 RepID=A0A0L0G116_9EUKA|nr:hypothetical protein SARC_04951 [Sphaeroforma arctica JP610]KNC82775.1 hypothetical protein SARC_04951 [Sphaeroforma arctica JP610]|eukprot:XP_014156677.1 hypothetical protein SARC_04951 [Sphaeroforma arctica JP610]